MGKLAYVVYNRKQHDHLLLRLRDHGVTTMATIGRTYDADVLGPLHDAGTTIVPLEGLCNNVDRAQASESARSRIEQAVQVLKDRPIRIQRDERLPIADDQRREALADIEAAMAESAMLLRALDRFGEQYDVGAYVCSEEYSPLSRVTIQWARAHGIPSFHVNHALNLGSQQIAPKIYGQVYADYVLAPGARGARSFLSIGYDPAKVVVAGVPAFDVYAELTERREEVRREFRTMCGLRDDCSVVVFALTPNFEVGTMFADDIAMQTLRAYAASAKHAIAAGANFAIVMKDRMYSGKVGKARIDAVANANGLQVLYATGRPEKVVCAADVVVARDSSMAIEAILCGVPAVNLWTAANWLEGPYFQGNDGFAQFRTDQTAELGTEIVRLLADAEYRSRSVAAARVGVADIVHAPDGQAAARCATFITSIASV